MKYFLFIFRVILLLVVLASLVNADEIGTELSGVVGAKKYFFSGGGTCSSETSSTGNCIEGDIPSLFFVEGKLAINFPMAGGKNRIYVEPGYRWDDNITNRTRGTLKEFYWLFEKGELDVKFGRIVEHWGVMESRSVVDVINSVDNYESFLYNEKIAQEALKVGFLRGSARVDLYALQNFEPTHFYNVPNRLQPYEVTEIEYGKNAGPDEIDFAGRYSQYFGDLEIAGSVLFGTNREPLLVTDGLGLKARYNRMSQQGLEISLVESKWLYKLEAFAHQGDGERDNFHGLSVGGEYSFLGFYGDSDITFVGEYYYDEKQRMSSFLSSDNNVMAGARIEINDFYLSSLLAHLSVNLDDSEKTMFFLEGDIGISDALRVKFSMLIDRMSLYDAIDEQDGFGDYVRISVEYHY